MVTAKQLLSYRPIVFADSIDYGTIGLSHYRPIAIANISHSYGNSRAIRESHSITLYQAEVTFLPLPQAINAATRFSKHKVILG